MSQPRNLGFLALGLVFLGLLALPSCSTLGSAFSPSSLLDTALGAAAGNPSDQAKLDQLASAGKAVEGATREITPEEEYFIGRAVAATVLATNKPWQGQEATTYLNRLGQALVPASSLPETWGGYHFLILDSGEINAFGAPGGLILVSRGLLDCAQGEDEVAAILAHEIGHVSLKHGLKAISKARWTEAALKIGSFAAQNSGSATLRELTANFGGVIDDVVTTMVNSGYSKDLEKQADLEAIRILDAVGYDPGALAKILGRMKSRLKAGTHDFAATHPSPDERIDYLTKARRSLYTPYAPPPAAQVKARQDRWLAALGRL